MSFNTPITVCSIPTDKLDPICAVMESKTQSKAMPRLNSAARFQPKPLEPRVFARTLRTRFGKNPYMTASSELSLQLIKHREGKSFSLSPFDSPLDRLLNKKDDDCIYIHCVITPIPSFTLKKIFFMFNQQNLNLSSKLLKIGGDFVEESNKNITNQEFRLRLDSRSSMTVLTLLAQSSIIRSKGRTSKIA